MWELELIPVYLLLSTWGGKKPLTLLFFIMWELELIVVYLLLSIWGGKKRLYSTIKFIMYAREVPFSSLMGVMGIGLYDSNEPALNFETSANPSYPIRQ